MVGEGFGLDLTEFYKALPGMIFFFFIPSRYFCGGSFCFMSWCLNFFVLLAPYVCFHIFS